MNRMNPIPKKPSIVVIGGGIIGLNTAFQLRTSFPESSVTILEQGNYVPYNYATSTRSAACTRQQFGCEHNVAMSMFSTRFYERFGALTGEQSKMLWQKGYLFLYRDSARWAQAQARALQQQRWGLHDVRALPPAEVAKEFPFVSADNGLVGATFCPTDGYLDPWIIMTGLKEWLLGHGAIIMTKTKVVGFDARDGSVKGVRINGANIQCDFAVNCAGPWSARIGNMLGTRLEVWPEKRYLWHPSFVNPADDFSEEVFSQVPMTVCMGNNGLNPYIRPEPGANPHSFVVGCEHKVNPEPNFADEDQDRVDPEYRPPMGRCFEPIWDTLVEFAPFAEKLGFPNKVSGGFYETTPSHNPYITFDPSFGNVIHACGFSGHGVMHAPAAGAMVASLIANGNYGDLYVAERSVTYRAHLEGTGETEEMKI